MLKKIISLILILVCMLCSIGFAQRMTDSKGYMRNGKLEEYDRRAKEARSTGFDKRGYYIEPYYRNELVTGLSEEEWDEIDKSTPSYHFYPDGTPKPGTFPTPEEIKAEEELKRLQEERLQERLEMQRQYEQEEKERRRKNIETSDTITWIFIAAICSVPGLNILSTKLRKREEEERQKKLTIKNIYNIRSK